MRIALVSPFDPFPSARDGSGHVGGVERVYAEVANRLARRGHDVTVVCSSHAIGPGVEGQHVQVLRTRRTATFLRTPIAALASKIPADADIIHIAATYPFTTPSALRRAQELGIPSILDFHFEPDPVSPLGRLAARAYRFVGPRSYQIADTVIVRSTAYGQSAPSLDNVPIERWRALPNGIEPQRFHPDGPSQGDGHLLFVGRLVPYKGLDVLLRALALMDSPPPLWVVGDGPMRQYLQTLARNLDVDATFLGSVSDDELPALYRGARLTVLPSVGQQECFGITLLESMACGTPVVASDIPGVRAVAMRGGLVAPSGDVEGWARVLQDALVGDLPRGVVLAKQIHDECSWDAVTDQLVRIYEETLGTRMDTVPPVAP